MASGVRNSGHVTYSTQQMAFYQMCQRRGERVEAARNHGVLEYKKTRNPLAAEKTPRGKDYKCFDFSIPTGRKDLKEWERWEYPEMDFGLMGKFKSQKHIYDQYMSKHDDYKRKLQEFRDLEEAQQDEQRKKHEDATQRAAEDARRSARTVQPPGGLWSENQNGSSTARSSARGKKDDFGLGYSTSRVSPRKAPAPKVGVPQLPIQGEDSDSLSGSPGKISDFRMIAEINPEALAKWRAKRAADFVTKQKHPLDPPTSRELLERPFVVTIPRGKPEPKAPNEVRKIYAAPSKFGIGNTSGGGGSGPEVNTGRLQESLSQLMGELARTESEIERNQLKLGLKGKSSRRY